MISSIASGTPTAPTTPPATTAPAAPKDTFTPNALSSVPESLLPMGQSKYQAFVGTSYRFSKNAGNGEVVRTANHIEINSSEGGATLDIDPTNPAVVMVKAAGGNDFEGQVHTVQNGVSLDATDGRSIIFQQDGNRLDVHLKGFGWVQDHIGVFLVRQS